MAPEPVAPWLERPVRSWAEFSAEEQAAVLARLRERLRPEATWARKRETIMGKLEFGKRGYSDG